MKLLNRISQGRMCLLLGAALTLAGCGERSSADEEDPDESFDEAEEPPERSGVTQASLLASLTVAERGALCEWADLQVPAYNIRFCSGGTLGHGWFVSPDDCRDTFHGASDGGCAATVADYENCIRPLACDTELWAAACVAADACDPNGDIYSTD